MFSKKTSFSRIFSSFENGKPLEVEIKNHYFFRKIVKIGQEIWIASYGAGITCILPDNLLFQNIMPEKGNHNSLVANEGVSVHTKKPLVYFGTN